MFKFNRGGTDYEIKLENKGDDDLLVCTYIDGVTPKWRAVQDTYDLTAKGSKWEGDEVAFLEAFLVNLNNNLDKAHGKPDPNSQDAKVRLEHLLGSGLIFNQGNGHVEIS